MKKHKQNHKIHRVKHQSVKSKIYHYTSHKKLHLKNKAEIKKEYKEPKKHEVGSNLLESYKINLDNASIDIKIEKTEKGIEYKILFPEIGVGTKALLDDIRKELVSITSIGAVEMSDIKMIERTKKEFIENALKLIKQKIPEVDDDAARYLVGFLMQEMLGLKELEFLINDPNLEEIVVPNGEEPVRVYHKSYGWLITNLIINKEDEINNYANIIARRVGRQINVLTPLLDAHLVTGDRANAVLNPISTKGNTITIRKFARDPWTIIDLIKNNTVNFEVAALLWLAIEYEMNVLISGGTASGKTSFLNSCMIFIPPNHRIISMEDTRELMLPDFLYWTPLVTRSPNPEGKGEVAMLDLLVNSLRMRPDRIILGEIRRQREAEVLFEAMHTGHSVYATVHADTSSETISRLTNPPINVPHNLLKAVNLNIVMFRDRRKGLRRVYQVSEFITTEEGVSPNILFRWTVDKDSIVKHSESVVLMEDISRHTAMSHTEIEYDLVEKKKILKWMFDKNIRELRRVGKIINLYYTNKGLLNEIMKKNDLSLI